jgi:hypothetical protein
MRRSSYCVLTLLVGILGGIISLVLSGPVPSRLEGRVIEDDGPIPGARIRFQGTSLCTRSDHHGRFRLSPASINRRVTAWKEGYFIGGATSPISPTIHLEPLPKEDYEKYEWVDPAPNDAESHNCGNCHAEIYREWLSSGHARSAGGRRFRNLYEGTDWHGKPDGGWGLLTQYPDGLGVCASCHAPTAKEFDLREVRGVAAAGVHCDYCHKINGVADGRIGLSHGRYNLQLLRPTGGQLFFGSLDDVARGEDAYSPIYRDSRYCASCHEGIIFGVHVYSTYSEWQASSAALHGVQCQDCHMKPTGRMTNLAPAHGGIERDPITLHNHRFFDGDQASMLRRTLKASAELEREGEGVKVRVRLWCEGVGHRLPTGFVDRHLVLVLEGFASDGSGLSALDGPTLPSFLGEEFVGRPGRLMARLLHDFNGRAPVPFWLASPDPPPDTRLIPDRIQESRFLFPRRLERLRLRVWYRRFWPEVTQSKQWPKDDILVIEQDFSPPR